LARQGVGANGSVLMADSAQTNGIAWSTAQTSNRNAVINGAMQIWQRGTSFSSIGFTAYTADRMFFFSGTNIDRTVSRQNTSDTTNLPNLFYCTRVQRTAAASDLNATNISQSFESSNSVQFSGKSVTFSFYARAGADFSAASSALTVTVRSGTGADQNIATGFTGSTNVFASSATLTTTWQRFTFTGTVAASATQLGWILGFTPVGTAGAADYFEVTGIQMESGSVATPFEFEDYGTTLAKCQRYYFRSGLAGGITVASYTAHGYGYTESAIAASIYMFPPVALRSPTTMTLQTSNVAIADSANSFFVPSSYALNGQSPFGGPVEVLTVIAGATANLPARLCNNNNTSGFIALSSEL
jgi:hypothetical protein